MGCICRSVGSYIGFWAQAAHRAAGWPDGPPAINLFPAEGEPGWEHQIFIQNRYVPLSRLPQNYEVDQLAVARHIYEDLSYQRVKYVVTAVAGVVLTAAAVAAMIATMNAVIELGVSALIMFYEGIGLTLPIAFEIVDLLFTIGIQIPCLHIVLITYIAITSLWVKIIGPNLVRGGHYITHLRETARGLEAVFPQLPPPAPPQIEGQPQVVG